MLKVSKPNHNQGQSLIPSVHAKNPTFIISQLTLIYSMIQYSENIVFYLMDVGQAM